MQWHFSTLPSFIKNPGDCKWIRKGKCDPGLENVEPLGQKSVFQHLWTKVFMKIMHNYLMMLIM
jgi:hypothetical protein